MNIKLAIAAAGVALFAVALLAVRGSHHAKTADPADRRTSSSRPAATSAFLDGTALLPFDGGQISQAAGLATRFAATFASHRYDETPSAYLNRLAPMMSPQLRTVVERAATDPATLTQRRRLQQITTAHARPEAIRALGPTSITFLVAVTEHVATAHANRADTDHYALTLTHAADQDDDGSGGWRVYAVEFASTGNTGQITATRQPAS
ncbi:hypothetical protein [Actinoallomurus iriomotensis]|uniref:Mce-associated membrane protein n=1 Tax=Actinoallomurus iriomotensis TaxID=478107 RepID=A0A9W6VUW8_9ACTN|nr:hypothetical protein [Actinoallomurus iriomotensis]GLY86063.1 hypothetical protein Airi02_039920 [Actinoallomurus iriomotensis]